MRPSPMTSSVPIPPPPPAGFRIRSLFQFRDAERRWPFAARAALCMGVPVVAGWAAGDIAAGLMATIGAFTALYGNNHPYRYRAGYLAIIATSFAGAVSLGVYAASTPWLAVPAIALTTMVAAYFCNALRVGPPGAYMFTLACAVGTWLGASHLPAFEAGMLVFAGGAFAWLMHMAGALLGPRAPEKAAVAAAGVAVARFIEMIGTQQQDAARHAAAMALHDSWATLVTHQPARLRSHGRLSQLRALNRELHLLFVEAMNAARLNRPMPPFTADRARVIAREAKIASKGAASADSDPVPLGYQGTWEALRQSFRPRSTAMRIMAQVGIATVVAGVINAGLGIERTYWTISAAVLVLDQGLDWARTQQRSIERVGGTLIGLILAGAILTIHPVGLWLAATLMLLQFVIEMCVIRNYALAVVFMTASGLTIAAGGHGVPDVGHLLWVRGMDTAIGCAVGLATFILTAQRSPTEPVSREIVRTLNIIATTIGYVADGAVTTLPARRARRDLQHAAIGLLQTYNANIGASRKDRESAEHIWPTVVAAQRLAYRMLSVCWTIEKASADAAARDVAHSLFGADGDRQVISALAGLSAAIRAGSTPPPIGDIPACLGEEIRTLHHSVASR